MAAISLSRTFFLFGLIVFLYVVGVSYWQPYWLDKEPFHLLHGISWLSWLRNDTMGVIAFVVSLFNYFVWCLLRRPVMPNTSMGPKSRLRKITMSEEKSPGAISTYYSHISRLFVSSYATFFVIYVGFISFVYQSLGPRPIARFPAGSQYFAVALIVCVLEFLFLTRSIKFGNVLDRIERESLILMDAGNETNVQEYYWQKPLDYKLRRLSPSLAGLAIVSIPILVVIMLYTPWLK